MPFILAVLGAMAFAAVWWYRLKYMSEAANEVADAVGRVQGRFRRNKLRKKAAMAPITAIDDPVTAAVTVITAIGSEDTSVSEQLEHRVRAEARAIAASDKKLDEAVIYAKWATDQVADVQTVIDQAAKLGGQAGRIGEGRPDGYACPRCASGRAAEVLSAACAAPAPATRPRGRALKGIAGPRPRP